MNRDTSAASLTAASPRTLLFIVNSAGFFLSHRLAIAVAARELGYDVHVATADDAAAAGITEAGLKWHALPISRSGVNPLVELFTLGRIFRLLLQLRPNILHLVTIKPVIYGGIAARFARTQALVASISGLGFTFSAHGFKARLAGKAARMLYGFALRHRNARIIFQNPQDFRKLYALIGGDGWNGVLIKGSGVDLQHYSPQPFVGGVPVVLFAARLLIEKGVLDFVEAARILRKARVSVRFCIAGSTDLGNPNSLSEHDLARLREEGVVDILGQATDMPALMASARVVVLPSYYGEGLPKVLIEAAACGRPVVTTDHPGCRDAVEPNVTGVLVPVRDPDQLAETIHALVKDLGRCEEMGRAGREFALQHFDVRQVVATHLEIYQRILVKA